MKNKSLVAVAAIISVFSAASTVTGAPRHSGTYTVLHTFCSEANCADGSNPLAALVRDSSGNLFGTTRNGGAAQDGVIFELSPSGSAYTYQVLYNFCVDDTCTDGDIPTTRLVLDTMGNLYGTTYFGGNNDAGTVFKLSPGKNGKWAHTKLYDFCSAANCDDGEYPVTDLTYQGLASGALYDGHSPLFSAAINGGVSNGGVAYELTFTAKGHAKERVIYNVCTEQGCPDGRFSDNEGLVIDQQGIIYGTKLNGGTYGQGAVFRLVPKPHNKFRYKQIYSFCAENLCPDGATPRGNLIFNQDGALVGATEIGGQQDAGTLYELDVSKHEPRFYVLYNFCQHDSCSDGGFANGSLAIDASGSLYGTTVTGGNNNDGVIFKLAKNKYTVLHKFCDDESCSDGAQPIAPVILDPTGKLFGTVPQNNAHGDAGTVFQLSQ